MSTDETRSNLFIIPVSSDWISDFDRTVRMLYTFGNEEFPSDLLGTDERVWGMMDGSRNKTTFEQMVSRDWLLFYHEGKIFSGARVGVKFEGADVGEIIWDSPPSRLCFTIEDFQLLDIPISKLRNVLRYQSGFYPRGPIRVSNDAVRYLLQEHGSIAGFIDHHGEPEPADEGERVPDYIRPNRTDVQASRVVRNTQLVKHLKQDYDHQCQICGDRRKKASTSGYAEGHHLRPLGAPHEGPDIRENIVILCPNHHADFDYGMIKVDPGTLEITHAYEKDVQSKELMKLPDHNIESEFLKYHNEHITEV